MGGSSPVREHPPVVNRPRPSVSPSVPTYPGRISLALEPLIIRRTGFSPVFRYSCLHSHSCGVHRWVTPRLHSPHDAPLPIHTPEPRRAELLCECHSFGGILEPRYMVGAESLDQ